MDLRRVRLQITALNLVLFAIAIGVVSVLVVRSGHERIDNEAQREAQVALSNLLVDRLALGGHPPDNTWLVDADAKYVTRLGDTEIEPPVVEFARATGDQPTFADFRSNANGAWIVATQRLTPKLHAAAAINVDRHESDKRSLRTHVTLIAVGLVAACAWISYWFAGRSLAPARRAMECRSVRPDV